MGDKDKTISFRVNEESFEMLRNLAEDQSVSLSQIFRDYVHIFNQHDGRVEAVPTYSVRDAPEDAAEFPITTEVTTKLVREHERLELETEHLREQLDEYKTHADNLEQQLDAYEAQQDDMVYLEDLDVISEFQFEDH